MWFVLDSNYLEATYVYSSVVMHNCVYASRLTCDWICYTQCVECSHDRAIQLLCQKTKESHPIIGISLTKIMVYIPLCAPFLYQPCIHHSNTHRKLISISNSIIHTLQVTIIIPTPNLVAFIFSDKFSATCSK